VVDVTLHIGSGKTGTSSIQRMCTRNRRILADEGVLYPQSPGTPRHVLVGMACRPDEGLTATVYWRRMGKPEPEQLRSRVFAELQAEIVEAGTPRLLLSDEGIYSLPEEGIERLSGLLERFASSVRLVVYLRRQDDHLISRYQQSVKVGETRRLADFVELDYARGYDYYTRLTQFRSVIRPDEFVVRPFDRSRFPDGSVLGDFLAASKLATPLEKFRIPGMRNESLDAERIELMRLVNIAQIELHGAPDADNRPIVRALRAASRGPVLTLPEPALDEFMAKWDEPNRAVAREYLGEAELFTSARKTTGVTTRQHLDPKLLDSYTEQLDIPADLRLRLREVTEREAKSAAAGPSRS